MTAEQIAVRPAYRRWWLIALVIAAAALPYLQVIPDYFIQDDFGTVYILAKRSWTTFPRWFTMPWMEDIWGYTPDEIRPFVAFTYQLTGKFTPTRPELHHIFNIALHVGNSLLVMAIARMGMGLSVASAALAGVVFAVLPSQPESVAWITGRVDSMPAFLYLATFCVYLAWRRHRGWPLYACALVVFFMALFSKQNTITMVASLAAYDLLVVPRRERGSLASCVAAWAPFAIMTIGYLALRRAILGHTVRGGVSAWHQVETFLGIVERHRYRVIAGHLPPFDGWEIAIFIGIVALTVYAVWQDRRFVRLLLCFVAGWWWIGVAPAIVAGYESPRHAYLASAAWAFLLALLVNTFQPGLSSRTLRAAGSVAIMAIVGIYVVRLHTGLQTWRELARVSQESVGVVQAEAMRAAPGTLLLMSVPVKTWEWGVPFVLRWPYQTEDLTARINLVTPWQLYCCGARQWGTYARDHLKRWVDATPRPPLVAVYYDVRTKSFSRVTGGENPELTALVPALLQTDTPEAMDRALLQILERTARR